MNQYEKALQDLKALRCPVCHGSGECDDADFGDIQFNRWMCPQCDGTGMKPRPEGDLEVPSRCTACEVFLEIQRGNDLDNSCGNCSALRDW